LQELVAGPLMKCLNLRPGLFSTEESSISESRSDSKLPFTNSTIIYIHQSDQFQSVQSFPGLRIFSFPSCNHFGLQLVIQVQTLPLAWGSSAQQLPWSCLPVWCASSNKLAWEHHLHQRVFSKRRWANYVDSNPIPIAHDTYTNQLRTGSLKQCNGCSAYFNQMKVLDVCNCNWCILWQINTCMMIICETFIFVCRLVKLRNQKFILFLKAKYLQSTLL